MATDMMGFPPQTPFMSGADTFVASNVSGLSTAHRAAIFSPNLNYSNVDIVLAVKGAGAIAATYGDNSVAGGQQRGDFAVDLQISRSNSAHVALGQNSVVAGGADNTADNNFSTVSGGRNNSASGTDSCIGGGNTNIANTSAATVSGGNSNLASGAFSAVGGGTLNTASGTDSTIGGGKSNTATGNGATVAGGETNVATAGWSTVGGGNNNTVASTSGYGTVPGGSGGRASASGQFAYGGYGVLGITGQGQWSRYLLTSKNATGTSPVRLYASGGSTATLSNHVYLSANSSIAFKGRVVGRRVTGNDTAVWEISGVLRKDASAASTVLSAPTVTVINKDAGASTWDVALTADTTLGTLAVNVTGDAGTAINWIADIDATENAT